MPNGFVVAASRASRPPRGSRRPPQADTGGYGGSSPRETRLTSAPDTMAVFAIGRTSQHGVSVVIATEPMSIASLMCMVPSLTLTFIAARTSFGWALSS